MSRRMRCGSGKTYLFLMLKMLETGNGTVTPVVSNLRIDPALVDGYLPFAHFFPSFFIPYALPTR